MEKTILVNKKNGEKYTLSGGVLYAQNGEREYNFAINTHQNVVEELLKTPEFADFELFVDVWAFEKYYRYSATNAEIGALVNANFDAFTALNALNHVKTESGRDLYFAYIEPQFLGFIDFERLEMNDNFAPEEPEEPTTPPEEILIEE
jgi:hypothetical protein